MTTTPNLALVQPSSSDNYQLSVWTGNQSLIDASPGVFLAANASAANAKVAGFGSSQKGMMVYEQDTDTYWRWTGSALTRIMPKGLLGSTSGTGTVSFNAGSGSPTTILSTSVVVPPGSLTLRVIADLPAMGFTSTSHETIATFSLFANGVAVNQRLVQCTDYGGAVDFAAPLYFAGETTIAAGTYTFALEGYVSDPPNICHLQGSSAGPIWLRVDEV